LPIPNDFNAVASGKPDGNAPGWSIATKSPPGWTADCCKYAQAIGVNLVLYQGDWTGNPEQVMVLNVWPRKLPSLDAEWKADQAHYLKGDSRATVGVFPIASKTLACHGVQYQGTDHIDDLVVFCEPAKASGIRLSWSMTVAANDPRRPALTALFTQVVEASVYARQPATPAMPAIKAIPH
jgi:hypothetical protein